MVRMDVLYLLAVRASHRLAVSSWRDIENREGSVRWWNPPAMPVGWGRRFEGKSVAEMDPREFVLDENRLRGRAREAIVGPGIKGDGNVTIRKIKGNRLPVDRVVFDVGLVDGVEILPDFGFSAAFSLPPS